ncbi:UDP-N-acetylmuramoyl-L-alanine--D-glutamate ligase [Flavobacteriaceae bacterium]|nr:UDP-N-acetylmuramoyl-L-alanine--D-glutamate ligase [Flavobacteriaceae bacterium]
MMQERLVVLGAGESGIGAAILAKKQGFDVFLSDKKSISEELKKFLNKEAIKWESGKHTLESMKDARLVIKSPGIPDSISLLDALRKQGSTILSEIEFASHYTNATLIGITGTNGKTTTTMLTYEILKNAGLNVGLAGNIGTSFARQVAQEQFDYYVLEISSFQLDNIHDFAPHISVITNITPDHLDRYSYSLENYIKSKFKIIQNQTQKDFFLFNADDPILKEAISEHKNKASKVPYGFEVKREGSTHENDHFILKHRNKNTMIDTTQFTLTGRHNLLNAMAAATIGSLLDISKDTIRESLTHFKGAPHRMEKVLTIQRVSYINDSKATNVNATYFALESIDTPLIWIVGGVDKGNDYTTLLPLIRTKAKAIICLGEDNEALKNTFERVTDIFIETQSMSEAVKIAHKVAAPKDTVLLSPACASFDLFENYEDRGNQFKNAVRNL